MAYAEDYAMIGSYIGANIERVPLNNKKIADIVPQDESETAVDFMNDLYRNRRREYVLGAWIVKPVVEILLYFMGVPRVLSEDKALEKVINDFYKLRKGSIVQLLRELGLYGRVFCVQGFNSDLNIANCFVKNSDYVVDIRYENMDDPDEITYVRIREIIKKSVDEDESSPSLATTDGEEVVYDKIFWKELRKGYDEAVGNIKVSKRKKENAQSKIAEEGEYKFFYKVLKKDIGGKFIEFKAKSEIPFGCIPVIEFNQSKLSSDKTGYSDTTGIVPMIGAYHQILEGAIDSNVYNGKPIPVFTGLKNSRTFVSEVYGDISESNQNVAAGSYEQMGSYFLEGDADIHYLQTSESTVSQAAKLLEILFYIFVQVTGVPEWALGAHINGAWASTKMQATPLVQKIKSKRLDINDSLIMMHINIAKIYEAHNPSKKFSTYLTEPVWDEPLPEDQDKLLSIIQTLIPLDVLTPETIIRVLDFVSNPEEEVKRRKDQKRLEKIEEPERRAILDKVKKKLSDEDTTVNDEAGEMSEIKKLDITLKSLFGPDYLELLGMSEE